MSFRQSFPPELKPFLKDKKLWATFFIIAWAAGIEIHMRLLERHDAYKEKFGKIDQVTNIQSDPE